MDESRRITGRSVYQGRILHVCLDRVKLPNGNVAELEVIRHPGAAAVVPLTAEGDVLLVRQYRYASGGFLLEVPAGKLDPGESPETCAAREIEEEVGHRAGQLEPMGWIFTTPGFTDERIWLYLARDLTRTAMSLQHDEVLTVEQVPLGRAVEMAQAGEIRDAKTVCALLRAARFA